MLYDVFLYKSFGDPGAQVGCGLTEDQADACCAMYRQSDPHYKTEKRQQPKGGK